MRRVRAPRLLTKASQLKDESVRDGAGNLLCIFREFCLCQAPCTYESPAGIPVSSLQMRGLLGRHSPSPKEADDVFLLYTLMASALVLMAGLMSGLTLGLLSLDAVDLEVRLAAP